MVRFLYTIEEAGQFCGSFEAETVRHAKCDAVRLAGERLCDIADTFWDSAEFRMTVADENGLTLFSLQVIATEAPSIMLSGDGIAR
ncbi:MAG: DUF6894 family protein [Alphaproteobacteria bacterium]